MLDLLSSSTDPVVPANPAYESTATAVRSAGATCMVVRKGGQVVGEWFWDGRTPATQVFQALRIAVNDELGEIDRLLDAAPGLLRPGGRLVLVAFHSLEDRRIKRFIDDLSERRAKPSRHLPQVATAQPKLRWLERKVIKPGDAEVARNPRARSARLRAAVRLADADTAADDQAPAGGDATNRRAWRLAA